MNCLCDEVGEPDEKWCGRDTTEAPMYRNMRDHMARLLSDELGIDAERVRFTVRTGCFNRPARGTVEVVGWSVDERERTRQSLTRLFRKAVYRLEDGKVNPDHDVEVERFSLRCWVELKERGGKVVS